MAEKVEIRITGREIIKPSVPTPAHLSRFNLSFLDQLTDDSYTPLCWFFSGNGIHGFQEKCRELKSSLAEALSAYYPMAGRIRDLYAVDCCDDGMEFVEAKLNCPISLFLGFHDLNLLQILVPVQTVKTKKDRFLCAVQATLFECGGVAVTVCISHRISDAAAYGGFVKAWGKMATRSGGVEPIPSTGLAQILPPVPRTEKPSMVNNIVSIDNCVSRKFVFSAAKIEELKARASSSVVARPTRAEAVTALLWKCSVSASRSVNGPSTGRRSAVSVSVNLRRRLPTILSENSIGNHIVAGFATSEMADPDVSDLVVAMRKAVEAVNNRLDLVIPAAAGGKRSDVVDAKEILSSLSFEEVTRDIIRKMGISDCFYIIQSSLAGLIPINVDLGLGRSEGPIPVLSIKNTIGLMHTEDMRGLQAWVTLGKQEMEVFEKDTQLLSFAAPAPMSINAVKSNL